ncbi:hypothetical protein F5146DRAFT_1118791 [Armillaria mellea]|nr:hypothetical protein F5146DRAFT_1118791 [Armillaria mellea]
MAAPVRWQGCTIDVGVDFSGKLMNIHRIATGSLPAMEEVSSEAFDPPPCPQDSPFPRDSRTTYAQHLHCDVDFSGATGRNRHSHHRHSHEDSAVSLHNVRHTYSSNRRHRVLETRAQGGCLKTIQLPASLGIATWQNRRPKLAGPAFLPLGSDHAPRWRRLALRWRGELGGHQSGSACEAAGLHNRRGSRFWVQGSLLVAQDHPVDDLDAPPCPLRSLCPRYDRTTPAHALPPQNEQRLFARSPSTVAAVYTVAGPLGGTMRTVFRAPAVDLSSPLPTVCLNNPSLAHHNARGVSHVQHSIGSLHDDYTVFPTTNARPLRFSGSFNRPGMMMSIPRTISNAMNTNLIRATRSFNPSAAVSSVARLLGDGEDRFSGSQRQRLLGVGATSEVPLGIEVLPSWTPCKPCRSGAITRNDFCGRASSGGPSRDFLAAHEPFVIKLGEDPPGDDYEKTPTINMHNYESGGPGPRAGISDRTSKTYVSNTIVDTPPRASNEDGHEQDGHVHAGSPVPWHGGGSSPQIRGDMREGRGGFAVLHRGVEGVLSKKGEEILGKVGFITMSSDTNVSPSLRDDGISPAEAPDFKRTATFIKDFQSVGGGLYGGRATGRHGKDHFSGPAGQRLLAVGMTWLENGRSTLYRSVPPRDGMQGMQVRRHKRQRILQWSEFWRRMIGVQACHEWIVVELEEKCQQG